MAIKITRPDGTEITVDSGTEFAIVMNVLTMMEAPSSGQLPLKPVESPENGSASVSFEDELTLLKDYLETVWKRTDDYSNRQRIVLETVATARNPIQDVELRRLLGYETSSELAGVLSGISRSLPENLKPDDLWTRQTQTGNGRRIGTYQPTALLARAFTEVRGKQKT